MGERVTECEQVKAILVERHDVLLQVIFRDVVHPGVVFHLARIHGGVLESLRIVTGIVFCDKARNMVHMEMRKVDKPDAVGVHAESGEAFLKLPAESPEACVEQDVLAVDFHEERAHAGRDAIGHVQAVVERVARVAEEASRVQFFALVVLNPGDACSVCDRERLGAFNLCGGSSGGFCRDISRRGCLCLGGGFFRLVLAGSLLCVAASGDGERERRGAERTENLVHGPNSFIKGNDEKIIGKSAPFCGRSIYF